MKIVLIATGTSGQQTYRQLLPPISSFQQMFRVSLLYLQVLSQMYIIGQINLFRMVGNIAEYFNRLGIGRRNVQTDRQTTDRQTDGRQHIAGIT